LIKEKGLDISNPKDNTEKAISIYYSSLIEYVLKNMAQKLRSEAVPDFSEPVTVVIAGGSCKINGFLDVFKEQLGKSKFAKFVFLMILGGRDELRRELLEICTDSPLAQFRLWQLNQSFLSPKDACAQLTSHERLVSWHLKRIYRARNQIVHVGRVPIYIETLIMNLDFYYQELVNALLGELRGNVATRP